MGTPTNIEQRRQFIAKCQCCFCGKNIGAAKGLELAIFHNDESSQQIWSHVACLKAHLHPSVSDYVDEEKS
jgi:hypothetical protein